MVIASIDIQGGKVVQLKQGSELVLQRDNPPELAEEFDRYGEVAVIDLDAAMGKGNNAELIKPLLRKAECRVGGGIRTPEQARELISMGARKIIIGSLAFRASKEKTENNGEKAGGEFGLNRPFLEALVKTIGRERIIIAVDAKKTTAADTENSSARHGARGYEITVDGWKTPTGLPLIETAAEAAPYASELLFTCIDREGTMSGIDLAPVKQLCDTVGKDTRITAAGGVSTLEEVEALAALGCDVQLGMALYTGKINLADAFITSLNWEKSGGLIPLIAQAGDGQVMMIGFTDTEALAETFKRGNVCFHSRTRNKLWMKGENSGNTLKLLRLRADCDRDALLAIVKPSGPVCHTGAWSCFDINRRYTWEYLQSIIADRFRNPVPGSYTATLDDELVREKITEEAEELCTAKTHEEKVWEAADLLYFTTALMTRENITIAEVLDELDRRHKR
ncbi:MAG: phosphoribosyl-ATP diphosphatase [Spirochaetaceae bacterium]|jgi:phosphoribosyl-ATP pyrophosphohydrolase/phosphoribosyl-AMP cyclohydrolase|nr:phosphoribosyl-ATP diphosphatase [Spirochaetaceae bacterium]